MFRLHGPAAAAILTIALAALLLPTAVLAGGKHHRKHVVVPAQATATVFSFGITGGNIRPWSVTITSAGAVNADGTMKPGVRALPAPADTVAGLVALANAEGITSLPSYTACSGVLPDFAARFITLTTGAGTQMITVHGACNAHFNQMWAVLYAAAGLP